MPILWIEHWFLRNNVLGTPPSYGVSSFQCFALILLGNVLSLFDEMWAWVNTGFKKRLHMEIFSTDHGNYQGDWGFKILVVHIIFIDILYDSSIFNFHPSL